MRKRETKEVTSIDDVVVEIGCNKCGKTVHLNKDDIEIEHQREEFSEINLSFGYGNRYDSQRWSFDLCEDCLTALIKSLKYVPEGFGEDSYYAVYPQTMFEHWKKTGEIDLESGMTQEEIDLRGGSIYSGEEDKNEED